MPQLHDDGMGMDVDYEENQEDFFSRNNSSSLQDSFLKFREKKAAQKSVQKSGQVQQPPAPRSQQDKDALRNSFIQAVRKHNGTKPITAAIGQAIAELRTGFKFQLSAEHCSSVSDGAYYLFALCAHDFQRLSCGSQLKPGDFVFQEADGRISGVEVYLGPSEGSLKGAIATHPASSGQSYNHCCSLEPWLEGCPQGKAPEVSKMVASKVPNVSFPNAVFVGSSKCGGISAKSIFGAPGAGAARGGDQSMRD